MMNWRPTQRTLAYHRMRMSLGECYAGYWRRRGRDSMRRLCRTLPELGGWRCVRYGRVS